MPKNSIVLALVAGLLFVGCGPVESPTSTLVSFSPTHELNVALNRRVASTIAEAADGSAPFGEVQAFVTLAEDGEKGQLFVRVDGQSPVHIVDDLAVPVLDPETPPQVSVDRDNVVHIAYAASRNVQEKYTSMAIRYIHSDNAGLSWSDPVNAGGVDFGGYRNNHELHVTSDGRAYISWLDSNNDDAGSDAIHVAISSTGDLGKTWSPVSIVDEKPSCECCRVALTSTSGGTVVVAWRKIFDGGIRDIAVASSDDHGTTWSAPLRVFADDWVVGHCPDAGPSLVADQSDRLHIAWWTGKENAAGVKYARSGAGSIQFDAPIILKVDPLSRPSHVQLAVGPVPSRNDGGEPHREMVAAVWDDGSLKAPRIALRYSLDGGDSFGDLSYVSESTSTATYPIISFGAKEEMVIGWHTRGRGETMERVVEGDGELWTTPGSGNAPGLLVTRTSRH